MRFLIRFALFCLLSVLNFILHFFIMFITHDLFLLQLKTKIYRHKASFLIMRLFFYRFDFVCFPIVNPRYKREFIQGPARNRPGALTRADLCLTSSGEFWHVLT